MTNLSKQVYILDARRLLCPLPVIKLAEVVAKINHGEVIKIIATDPGVMQDIPAWCRINHHKLVKTEENNGNIMLWVQK